MLQGMADFTSFCRRAMLDATNRDEASHRLLSWTVDLIAPRGQPEEISKTHERAFYEVMEDHLRNYKRFNFINTLETQRTQRALVRITGEKWASPDELVQDIHRLCHAGDQAYQDKDLRSASKYFHDACDLISSTRRSPQGVAWTPKLGESYSDPYNRLAYRSHTGFADVSQERHAAMTVDHAFFSLHAARRIPEDPGIEELIAHSYFRLAMGYRLCGESYRAKQAIGGALGFFPNKRAYQDEENEILEVHWEAE